MLEDICPHFSTGPVPLCTRRGLGGVRHSGAHDLLKKEKNDLIQRSSRRGSIIPDAILGTFYWEEEAATEPSQELSPEGGGEV